MNKATTPLEFLMDATITKSPLVPSIFGYMANEKKEMKYLALLTHQNTINTALSQSEIPIITLEAARLLDLKNYFFNEVEGGRWFPIGTESTAAGAYARMELAVEKAAKKIDLSLYRAVVWSTTWLLGTALLEKSVKELEDIFALPTIDSIQQQHFENITANLRKSTGLFKDDAQ